MLQIVGALADISSHITVCKFLVHSIDFPSQFVLLFEEINVSCLYIVFHKAFDQKPIIEVLCT